jgi:sensor histidine kinase YesM
LKNSHIFFNYYIHRFFLFCILFKIFTANAQEIPTIPYGCNPCLDSLIKKFQHPNQFGKLDSRDTLKYSYTFEAKEKQKALLFIGDPDYVKIKHTFDNHTQEIKAGRYTPKSQLTDKERVFVTLDLKKGNHKFQISSFSKFKTQHFTQAYLIQGISHDYVKKKFESNNLIARIMGLGCIVLFGFVSFYSAFNAIVTKNQDFKNYAIYAFSIFIFLFLMEDWYAQWHFLFPEHPEWYLYLSDPAKAFILWVYLFFSEHFLALKQNNPKAYSLLKTLQHSLVALGIILSLTLFISHDFGIVRKVSIIYGIPAFMCMVLFYKIITGNINYLRYYVLLGGYIIFLGFLASGAIALYSKAPFYRSYYQETFHGIMGFNAMQVGIAIEMMVFLMAISLKNRDILSEKEALQSLTLKQFRENEVLQEEVENLLKERLEQSEKMLLTELAKTEKQGNEIELFKAQLKSLQLQMNPHYLFNSLNSINDFIISKKPEEASEYLALYARMMRNILRNSNKAFNTLGQELQFCEDYLKLEALRFEKRFEYHILFPKDLSILENKIPSMMLQTILENAVWHGIMPLKTIGIITVDASQSTLYEITIVVTDNGNGINELTFDNEKESYGLRNIKEKIEILDKLYHEKISFELINLKDKKGLMAKFIFPKMKENNIEL